MHCALYRSWVMSSGCDCGVGVVSICFILIYVRKQWVCLPFSKHYDPKPLVAGGLSSPWGHSTQQPPFAGDAYECQSSAGFLWSPPLLSAALNKPQGHNLLLLSFLQRDREKDICYFRQEAYWKSTHTIRTAQHKIIQFSCNQKKGEKREGGEKPYCVMDNVHFCASVWGGGMLLTLRGEHTFCFPSNRV